MQKPRKQQQQRTAQSSQTKFKRSLYRRSILATTSLINRSKDTVGTSDDEQEYTTSQLHLRRKQQQSSSITSREGTITPRTSNVVSNPASLRRLFKRSSSSRSHSLNSNGNDSSSSSRRTKLSVTRRTGWYTEAAETTPTTVVTTYSSTHSSNHGEVPRDPQRIRNFLSRPSYYHSHSQQMLKNFSKDELEDDDDAVVATSNMFESIDEGLLDLSKLEIDDNDDEEVSPLNTQHGAPPTPSELPSRRDCLQTKSSSDPAVRLSDLKPPISPAPRSNSYPRSASAETGSVRDMMHYSYLSESRLIENTAQKFRFSMTKENSVKEETNLHTILSRVFIGSQSDPIWKRLRFTLSTPCRTEAERKDTVEKRNENGETFLHLVCRHCPPVDIMESLLKISPIVASWPCRVQQWLPLHFECQNGCSEDVISRLISAYPPSITTRDRHGRTPLHLATSNSTHPPTFATLLLLMSSSSLINAPSHDGTPPITLQYIVDRARKTEEEMLNRKAVLKCLDMILTAKGDKRTMPPFKDVMTFLATLEEAPPFLQEQSVVHPYTQTILNHRLTRPFTVLVLMMDTYVTLMIIVCYRIVGYEANGERFALAMGTGGSDGVRGVAMWCVYWGAGYLLGRECLQACGMVWRGEFMFWLLDFWNWVDVLSIGSLFLSATEMCTGTGDDQTLRMLTVFTTGFMWVEALSILKTINQNFAVFVSGLTNMVWTLRPFLFTMGLLLVAFAQMFLSQYQGTDICPPVGIINTTSTSSPTFIQNNFCTMTNSYLKVYTMLVGGGVDEAQFIHDPTSLVLSVIFSFLILILLLNILIAIVTDSYGKVVKRSENVFWRQRLSFVFEVDQSYIFSKHLFQTAWRGVKRLVTGISYKEVDNGDDDEEEELKCEFLMSGRGLEFTNRLALLWDIAVTTFDDPTSVSTYKHRCQLRDEWKWPQCLIGNVVNPTEKPKEAVISFGRRAFFALLLPPWILLGFLSAGILWPPQVKRWMFCPAINETRGVHAGSKIDLSEVVKTKVETMETQMKRHWETVDARVNKTCSGMSKIEGTLDVTNRNVNDIHADMTKVRNDVTIIRDQMNDLQESINKIHLSLMHKLWSRRTGQRGFR